MIPSSRSFSLCASVMPNSLKISRVDIENGF